MEIRNKAAIVTGSSVGVGRATAVLLASKGCRVVVNSHRTAKEAEETAEMCRAAGTEAFVVQADISRDAECRRLVASGVERFGRLDILVNNAGMTRFVRFDDLEGLTPEMWEEIFATNVYGSFYCARAAVPHLRKAGKGAIVNVASVAGLQATGSSIAYAAAKAAVINMTLALARTLGPEIRVNAVAPGALDTRWIRDGSGVAAYEAVRDAYRQTMPLRDIISAEAVAEAIVWLIEGASMTTGEILTVDAGAHLGPGAPINRR
jgi:NAD(P)-dependent dehydrogenase (short-subunit alcohol dehydrogenase family)